MYKKKDQVSHELTWSLDALTNHLPPGQGHTPRTHSECPLSVLTQNLGKKCHQQVTQVEQKKQTH